MTSSYWPLQAKPYAFSVEENWRKRTCARCLSQSTGRYSLSCKGCHQVWYVAANANTTTDMSIANGDGVCGAEMTVSSITAMMLSGSSMMMVIVMVMIVLTVMIVVIVTMMKVDGCRRCCWC